MTLLIPRLERDAARRAVVRATALPLEEASQLLPDRSATVTYSAVGGSRIPDAELTALRADIVHRAREHGFPSELRDAAQFDGRCARLLRERLAITPHEASHEEVWSYLTCCWLLDVAIWRFGADADERRFIGNVNRNTFRRLWWRAEVLGEAIDLGGLGEDELVNVMERPTIAGDPRLARGITEEFLARVGRGEVGERMQLMREAMKRLLRLAPLVSFPALSDGETRLLIASTFDAAVAALTGRTTAPAGANAAAAPAPSASVVRVAAPILSPVSATDNGASRERAIETLAGVALDIARRTGRVTNSTLREVSPVGSDEAREVFAMLMARGDLVRRGVKRGTHYVIPDAPGAPAAEPGQQHESPLRRLLRRTR
jgi:hypothetical protein